MLYGSEWTTALCTRVIGPSQVPSIINKYKSKEEEEKSQTSKAFYIVRIGKNNDDSIIRSKVHTLTP